MPDDPYRYFRIEARELSESLAQSVLDLEKGDTLALSRILRAAHTLKGASRIVKHRELADLAHALEDVLVAFRDAPATVPAERIGAALRHVDVIATHVAALAAPSAAAAPEVAAVPDQPLPVLRAGVGEIDELVDGITQAHVQLTALREELAAIDGVRHLAAMLAAELRAPRASHASRAADRPAARAPAIADELGARLATFARGVTPRMEQIDRELRQVREDAERLRLLPARVLFTSLERAARDAAHGQAKSVAFVGTGGDVRLDADVLAALQPALVQIVRNAVAHGIEPEAARAAAGKPVVGRVEVAVRRRGGRVSFTCEDDGRGVDLDAVARVAQRRGMSAADARGLGPAELIRLLLRGGISTSRTVTELAGRGIGLDIVREAIAQLHGEVAAHTTAGRGTRVEVEVPVSLAAIDTLVVEASGQAAVIPLEAVRKAVRVRAGDVARSAAGSTILVDGAIVPFTPLARTLRASHQPAGGRAWSAVVIESGGAIAALGVDRVIGTENVVLRPLPASAPADAVVAGATFDAQGSPRLVLDPEALIAAAQTSSAEAPLVAAARTPVLVVDDSLTTRMLERSILESAGYDVEVATSGEEGLAMARAKAYALVLVDVEMPGISGFEVVGEMRADAELRRVPVIMVTSRDAPADRERAFGLGAQGYVVKSEFDQTSFLAQIRKLVA